MKRFFLFTVLSLFVFQLYSQEIRGRVVDSDGAPLIGANVVEKGTKNGVSTDSNGNFIIKTIKSNPVLVFSFIGFIDY